MVRKVFIKGLLFIKKREDKRNIKKVVQEYEYR